MSPRKFARLFNQEIGKTPGTHVEDLRLEAARRQLESTAASLEEVAKFSGFKSAEVLRRVFARRLGTTPGQYRKSFGWGGTRIQRLEQKSSTRHAHAYLLEAALLHQSDSIRSGRRLVELYCELNWRRRP